MLSPDDVHLERPLGYTARRIHRWRQAGGETLTDLVAEEAPVAMIYNEQPFAVMMATPCDLDDFALGFSLTEGLIDRVEQVRSIDVSQRLEGIELTITVDAAAPAAKLNAERARSMPGRSGCGLCGSRALEDAVRQPKPVRHVEGISAESLRRALHTLEQHQPMNAMTGSTHAAAWASESGQILLVREDVGRHNALDKLIGVLARKRYSPDDGFLIISSRASYEMVAKAAQFGIGFIAAVSAPTALAIDIARSSGVCLVGFARTDHCNVYTLTDRLRSSP